MKNLSHSVPSLFWISGDVSSDVMLVFYSGCRCYSRLWWVYTTCTGTTGSRSSRCPRAASTTPPPSSAGLRAASAARAAASAAPPASPGSTPGTSSTQSSPSRGNNVLLFNLFFLYTDLQMYFFLHCTDLTDLTGLYVKPPFAAVRPVRSVQFRKNSQM